MYLQENFVIMEKHAHAQKHWGKQRIMLKIDIVCKMILPGCQGIQQLVIFIVQI